MSQQELEAERKKIAEERTRALEEAKAGGSTVAADKLTTTATAASASAMSAASANASSSVSASGKAGSGANATGGGSVDWQAPAGKPSVATAAANLAASA